MVEVSISPRRNGIGKQFGFSRFVEVKDRRFLAVRLDNILILGKTIHVNLLRFPRGGEGKGGGESSTMSKGNNVGSGENI